MSAQKLPQLVTNYKAQSADGLSMGFLFIWLLGDITNLAGALVTNLAPSAVAIGSYFCVADVILISQSLYYNAINARRRNRERLASLQAQATEEEPLLSRRRSSSGAGGLPGSHRRHSVRRGSSGLDPLTRIVTGEDETPLQSPWLTNTLSLFAVYALGVAAWFVSREVLSSGGGDVQDPAESDPADAGKDPVVVVGMSLGYISALCYLCARIPQIIKNWREKSTEGLALLFFLLSLTGNLTYGASLVAYSQDGAYILKALPWLLGSLGTIAEDAIIFVQFKLYSKTGQVKEDAVEENGGAPSY
ncbi:putative vacuolar membrane pq loop repeat protein [Diaporthe ampelina]|uniref:Putative vacuolar membrane pq loop repeat protein n=1 Tax=Diaporthe ampelina TaxID=1214573 RepID=A0A0G2FQ79_9PEZI|nr:putative vacuolar membrane pq loop repeat protein [Diaporthe ampelina]